MACAVAAVLSLIPIDTSQDGTFLPYRSLIPLAPLSSVLILFVGGGLCYLMGRWFTGKPMHKL